MKWWLVAVFAVVLGVRLFFSFSTPFLTSDHAYLQYRMVEHIVDTGLPLGADSLGWAGSKVLFSPVFSYLLALFSFFLPMHFALKLFPNIFASLLVIPVYLIVKHTLKREWVSLLAAFVASFVPIFFSRTFNHASSLSLAVPLFFMLVYCWMRSDDRKFLYAFIALLILFAFLHPICLVFVLGIAFYIIMCAAEKVKIEGKDFELFLFSLGFALWAQFILYKKAIVFHGLSVFWLNIPSELLSSFFTRLSVLDVLLQVGFFPLLVGSYVLYRKVFKSRSKYILLFFSIALVVFLALWLKFIELFLGLSILGVLLVILSAEGLVMFRDHISETKFVKFENMLSVLMIVVVAASMLVPSVLAAESELDSTIGYEDVGALLWLREEASPGSIIAAPVLWGNYITAISNRPNVIDTNFLLHVDAEMRLHDINRVFESVLKTEIVGILDKYDADYVFFPPGFENSVLSDPTCFRQVYDKGNFRIYQKHSFCKLRVVS